MEVDYETLQAFKNRMSMRLRLAISALENLGAEKNAAVNLIKHQGIELQKSQELDNLCSDIQNCIVTDTSALLDIIDELEGISESGWQELYELQERYLSQLMLSFEQPLILHKAIADAFSKLVELSTRKVKRLSKAKPKVVHQINPVDEYNTPELQAIKKAIDKFWLDYDQEQPPLQKEVSFFIAAELGEDNKNRLTDTLATVIQPQSLRR